MHIQVRAVAAFTEKVIQTPRILNMTQQPAAAFKLIKETYEVRRIIV